MTVPVEDFSDPLADQFAALEDAVAAHRAGTTSNVAVVAEPFAGRGALLDYAEELLDEETVVRHAFDGPVTGPLPQLGEADAYVVDDCHYLYRRTVGGFETLSSFVERMTRSDALYVTSWNRYAWTYLAAVRDLDRVFPSVVHVTDFDADELGDVVESVFGPDLPTYVEDGSEGRIKSVEWTRYPLRLSGERTLSVPVLRPNPEYISAWATPGNVDDTEEDVLEKIRRAAAGNVGVATDLWARSVEDGAIGTGDVEALDPTFDLDEDGTMVLRAMLAKESLPRSALNGRFSDAPVDAVVQHLCEQGVLEVDDDTVFLTPQGLRPVTEALERRRLLW